MKKIQLGGHRYKNKPVRGYAIVDDDMYDELSSFKWSLDTYAKRKDKSIGAIYMHRVVLNAKTGTVVDHINGNTLDNRRSNLRFCSHTQNTYNTKKRIDNTSGYKGVSFNVRKQKWRAYIKKAGKQIHLGYFNSKIEASNKYNLAAKEVHGEFSRVTSIE